MIKLSKSNFDPPSKSAFDPVKKSAFDPVKKSAFDPVKKSEWDPPKKQKKVEIEYVQCNNCYCPIESSFNQPLCGSCVAKLEQELSILRCKISELEQQYWECPQCGYSEDD